MIGTDAPATGKGVHRQTGPTFYLATRLFPPAVRGPTHAMYGFFRIADEIVDSQDPVAPSEQRHRLVTLEREATGRAPPSNPIVADFRKVVRNSDIRTSDIEAFIRSMMMDVETDRYETFADLAAYLDGSAAAVGRMMLSVMDPAADRSVRRLASNLGIAFQLTNFIRDVGEDIDRYGRIYLPESTLREYGSSPAEIVDRRPTEEFRAAVRHELKRTESYYWSGIRGISELPEGCQFPVLLATVMYADHHRLVRGRDCDVLTATPTLGRRQRLRLLARTWWRWRRSRDPLETFASLAPVRPEPGDPDPPGNSRSTAGRIRPDPTRKI